MDSRWQGEIPDERSGKRSGGARDLSELVHLVHEVVEASRGDAIAIIDVLRLLERLHREVTEGAFQEALPQNRQELYKLLRVVEEEGGWPHIPRFKLQTLCSQLAQGVEAQEIEAQEIDDKAIGSP